MAINLRKPPIGTVRDWDYPRRVANEIIYQEGWIGYHIICNVMKYDDVRLQFRSILECQRDVFSPDELVDAFERSLSENICDYFHGEISYTGKDSLLLDIIDDLFEDNYYTETARALIYLLDMYCEGPKPDTDGHCTGKIRE